MLDSEMSAAWLAASTELGVEVIAPHRLKLADGRILEVEAFLPNFGGPNGTIPHRRWKLTIAPACSHDRALCLSPRRQLSDVRRPAVSRHARRLGLVWLGGPTPVVVLGKAVVVDAV